MAQFLKFNLFAGQKSILHHYYTQNVKDGIQIRVHTINKESGADFSQLISVKFLRKSHDGLREK